MQQMSFTVITGETIHRMVHNNLAACVDVVRAAYLNHERNHTVNPASVFLRFPDKPNARIIALPAHLSAPAPVSGLKWIASFPDNVKSAFPRASAVLLLNSHEHGYPFACLEASIISAARTAASAELAARALVGRPSARSFGIIGAGLIARYVYQFLVGTGWDIGRIKLFDADPAAAKQFAARWVGTAYPVEIAPDLGSVLGTCDVSLLATIAGKPHIDDPGLLAHRPVVLHLSLRDLSPRMVRDAFNVVDDIDHALSAGTSLQLAELELGTRSFVAGSIAAVIDRRVAVDHTRPRIFSPFGLGVLDVALGKWIYDRAIAQELGQVVPGFFYEMER
jgi:N-[(2S)-2-amino-2-carboxyethyl]-L-glutamate dehydrogenase